MLVQRGERLAVADFHAELAERVAHVFIVRKCDAALANERDRWQAASGEPQNAVGRHLLWRRRRLEHQQVAAIAAHRPPKVVDGDVVPEIVDGSHCWWSRFFFCVRLLDRCVRVLCTAIAHGCPVKQRSNAAHRAARAGNSDSDTRNILKRTK